MPVSEEVDSLDAYMASLELPSGNESTSMTQARPERGVSRSNSRGGLSATVKNRRYRRLQQLLQSTEGDADDRYFSDAMMQQRSPALFHFYLGQFTGMHKTAAAPADSETQSLSSFLIDTCQRSQLEARRVAEQETWGQFSAVDEKQEQSRLQRLYEDDGAVEEEEEEEEEEEDADDISVAERRQQLIEVMSTRFLQGDDGEYVDYAKIDADETLDDWEEMQRDAEDKYFAAY
ncbi:hypothetical protein PHYBOEH_006249 [Phytophthora boehmeriae]|uniref:CCD97-like C-terminal domain-containing protein n=1 Tax=Phytophthora boehmeriae TaxID=109152 RepID=A0A8T1X993_9STRA|nr:hypothetical protein PHYBOEH_006249 [Phytophthora boehmeriae]